MQNFLRSLLFSGPGKFIHAFFLQWYILVMGAAVAILYKVITTLQEKGLTKRFYNFVEHILNDITHVSTACLSHIDSFDTLWSCFHQ